MNKKQTMIGWRALVAVAVAVALAMLAAGVHYVRSQGEDAGREVVFIDASDRTAVTRGKQVYDAQCVACHGARLEGQLDWRVRLPNGRLPAPPHDETGHTWHHPDAVLFDIVKHGLVPGRTAPSGYESDMPAYVGILSDADIVAVMAYIKSTWPDEVRAMQEQITREQAGRR